MDPSSVDLPSELRTFLYICIDSAEQVDLLMRLRRLGKAMTVRELAIESGLTAAVIRPHLDTLTARGLVEARVISDEVAYRYAPGTPRLRGYTDLLTEYYGSHREAVIRFISSRSARTFADAFKIRKQP